MADTPVIFGADSKPLPAAQRQRAQAVARANMIARASMPSRGGYRGAGFDHASTRNWSGASLPTSEAMRLDRDLVASRVRDMVRDNPEVAGGIEKKVNNVIGTGWRLSSKPDHRRLGITPEQAELLGDQIEALWNAYSTSSDFMADAARNGDANDLLRTAGFHMAMDDEVFGLVVWRDTPSAAGFQTAMQLVHPGRCSNPQGKPNDETLRDGVSLDALGAATGAWFRKALPGESLFRHSKNPFEWDWFPRETAWGRPRLIHCKPVREAGLVRSISRLVSVMIRARQGDQYMDYETQASMVNAVMALFIETPLDMFDAMDSIAPEVAKETHADNEAYHQLNPIAVDGAQVNVLGPGEKPHLTSPGHPNTAFEPFVKKIGQTIASVLGITYEQLSGDWTGPNYATMRAAMIEVARGFRVDAGLLRKQMMNPWFRAWLEEVFDKKMLVVPLRDDGSAVPDFEAMPDAWCQCQWIGTAKGYVDPVKEAQAAGMRIALGLSTLELECGEQGLDWKTLVEQRAKELAYMLKCGLPQTAIDKVYGAPAQGSDANDNDKSDGDEAQDEPGNPRPGRRSIVPKVRRAA